MKAFISYCHADAGMLGRLHVHLANLKREGLISDWTDEKILAGGNLDDNISESLSSSQLFISLVSPDYIASHYCYEKEFETAQKMQEQGDIIIVPIIVEPCDWKSTPFSKLKALPKDGKPVAEWTSPNSAFTDVAQELRKLLTNKPSHKNLVSENVVEEVVSSRNYKAEKIFTEVDKLDFKETSFKTIKAYFKSAIAEFNGIENLQARFLDEEPKLFSCLISNKGNLKDAYITISIAVSNYGFGDLNYSFTQNQQTNSVHMDKSFTVANDEYKLYWTVRSMFNTRNEEVLDAKEIAEKIWDDYLAQVGVS